MSMGELGSLSVPVHLQTGALDRGLAAAHGRLRTFSTAIGTMMGNVTSRVAMRATAMAGDVLGGTAIDMERRIAGLAKATDLAGPKLAAMKGEIYALSTSLKGVRLDDLIDIAVDNGLHFDAAAQQGVMFHLIGALSEHGKLGTVCIGDTPAAAQALYDQTAAVLEREARRAGGAEQ